MEYKLHKYIYFHKIKEDVVCFDLLRNFYIIIPIRNFLLVEKYKGNIYELNNVNKHLFSLLYKTGFIINSDIEELAIAKSKYNAKIFHDKSYRLTLLPTLDCNFNCWYCYEKKKKGIMDKDIQERILKLIKTKIKLEGVSNFQLDWFGGEPLLCFDSVIYPLSKRILNIANKYNTSFSNQITTNGYLFTADSISKLNEIEMRNFQITLDGNEKVHNKLKKGKNSYQKTIENINLLCNLVNNPEIMLRINFSDENLLGCQDIIKDIPRENREKITINFQRIWQLKNVKDYYPEVSKVRRNFKDEGFNLFLYEPEDVSVCYADRIEQAVISPMGNVFKCTARDFTRQNADGFLNDEGVIEWNISKHSRRFGINAFEKYEECKECKILPACYGPCSQKVLETEVEDFKKICNYDGIMSSLKEYLEKQYEENFN